MSTTEHDPSTQLETRTERHADEWISTSGPIHVLACCVAAALAVPAVVLIDWLT